MITQQQGIDPEGNEMKLSEVRDADLVRVYIKLRETRAVRKAEYDTADSEDKLKQERIEGEFLTRFNERGLSSVSAEGVGTAYRSSRVSATVADWNALLPFIQANEAWEMLEHRVSKAAVEQYRAANDDLPPGVNWTESATINFRRS